MKRRWIVAAVVAAACVGWFARAGMAEEEPKSDPMLAQIKGMIEASKPGPNHALIAQLAGDFEVDGKTLMPSGEVKSEATVSGEMMFGGRYLRQSYKGGFKGIPMDGMALLAYDNAQKKFISIWIDSWNSGIYMAEGTLAADGKTLTLQGEWKTPDGAIPSRDVYTLIDKDSYRIESSFKTGEDWVKHVEMTFTRKGAKQGGFVAGCLENSGK